MNRLPSHPRGFSLIEVLVSVVVMSFGLLSLAALQGALFKAGAETRAQSAALALATEKIEFFEGYRDRAEFQSFTDGNDAAVTIDGVDYTRSWTIERFAYPQAGGSFAAVADTGATAANYVSNNEFKRIQVAVAWTDAMGSAQKVELEAAIAALSPQDSAKLAKVSSSGGPRGPEVIIVNPASEEGVIPIAVGDGSDTAATNPKPEVAGKSTSQRVIETRFDVLTYAALNDAQALAQSRVETIVAGCTCDYGTAPTGVVGKRPTYWNGLRYVVPEDSESPAPAGIATGVEVQSSHCTVCCRDHHDPVASEGARFDPRLGNHTTHSLYSASTGELAPSTGIYTEACRLIRVDGIFRVAADMYNDYMNLLETDNGASTTVSDYVPTPAATTNYQNFVLAYLGNRFVGGGSGTYNTVPPPGDATVASLEATHAINAPAAAITIKRFASSAGESTLRWLHDRGLYIDYLEDEAIQAINEAKADCDGVSGTPTSAELRTCVLKVLPFTTINLTELANWSPTTGAQIVVANNDFRTSLSSDVPVRGKVVPGSHPTPNTETNAIAAIRKSNSGVAVMRGAIDEDDKTTLTDAQPFKPDSSWSDSDGSAGSGGSFQIALDPYVFTNVNPTFSVSPTATCNPATSGTTQPNPFTCTTQFAGDPMSVKIANYNYQINQTSTASLTCYDSTGANGKVYPGSSYTTKVCRNFAVTGASGATSLTVENEGSVTETTTMGFPSVASGALINVQFGAAADTPQPVVCKYQGQGNSLNNYTITVEDCP
ncbi:MAG TPA: prepilin-type N-terminal cleavage/methylation domain-containing protein [Xanthomonadaceae bacterium]|nr:prepilin-type N-terminal cleavage/methylation domain-containing protein [Xanthomonadaceae bacterium]